MHESGRTIPENSQPWSDPEATFFSERQVDQLVLALRLPARLPGEQLPEYTDRILSGQTARYQGVHIISEATPFVPTKEPESF